MAQIRVSVANLCVFLQKAGEDEGSRVVFGIPNPKKLERGEVVIQALGGAAELTSRGVQEFVWISGAHGFEVDPETGRTDARFLIEDQRLEEVLKLFEGLLLSSFDDSLEYDPTDDIARELLGKEFPSLGSIISEDDLGSYEVRFVKTVRQAPAEDGVGTSDRAARVSVPTRRIFRLFGLVVSDSVYKKLRKSKILYFLTPSELATTEGGKMKGVTRDGYALADNLFRF